MDSDWPVLVEDNDHNRGQKYPGSINLFITICDYDEEKRYDDDEKDTQPNFKRDLPSGHPA